MTPALAIRFTLLMTLMAADADYAEVMAALLGDLALVPWQRRYQLPTATVASTWREAIGPQPLEELRPPRRLTRGHFLPRTVTRRTRRTWNRPQPGTPHALTLGEQPEPTSR